MLPVAQRRHKDFTPSNLNHYSSRLGISPKQSVQRGRLCSCHPVTRSCSSKDPSWLVVLLLTHVAVPHLHTTAPTLAQAPTALPAWQHLPSGKSFKGPVSLQGSPCPLPKFPLALLFAPLSVPPLLLWSSLLLSLVSSSFFLQENPTCLLHLSSGASSSEKISLKPQFGFIIFPMSSCTHSTNIS